MPPSNKIWTFDDLAGGSSNPSRSSNDDSAATISANDGAAPSFLKCCHIPALPDDDQAKAMLERVVREFEPIVKQRRYNVLSVSELCCCNDGLDFEPLPGGGRRRKRRKVSNNIWGYNQTTSSSYHGKSHTIHLRLRHTNNHNRFLTYEDVAGTMAHELAHCEHGPHNDKFYKLMDDILDQHAVIMASNLTKNGYSMPSFSGQGQTLGGGNKELAQVRRQQQSQNHRGYALGGDNAFQQWMTPVEAAVAAAEARRRQQQLRLRGEHCCRPCTIDIEDSDDDEEEEDPSGNVVQAAALDDRKPPAKALASSKSNQKESDGKKRVGHHPAKTESNDVENRKPPASKKAKSNGTKMASQSFIDLTADDSDGGASPTAAVASSDRACASSGSNSNNKWACKRCTFLNPHLALACGMCQTERK